MQICFRCDDSVNVLLERYAHAGGISKNKLMNHIIQEYLGQISEYSKAPSTIKAEKEILMELRQANKILSDLLIDTNDFYLSFHNGHTPQESGESLRLFRTELIRHLTDISNRLDRIRKDIVS